MACKRGWRRAQALPAVGLEIKNRLKDENVSLSLPSQRVDRFNEDIANIVNNGARKSGALGGQGSPSGGTSQTFRQWFRGKGAATRRAACDQPVSMVNGL